MDLMKNKELTVVIAVLPSLVRIMALAMFLSVLFSVVYIDKNGEEFQS